MPLPLPKNCRFDDEENGVAFEVDVEGRAVRGFITSQALEEFFAPCSDKDPQTDKAAKVKKVGTTSYITRKISERLKAGDGEPVFLNSMMFRTKND